MENIAQQASLFGEGEIRTARKTAPSSSRHWEYQLPVEIFKAEFTGGQERKSHITSFGYVPPQVARASWFQNAHDLERRCMRIGEATEELMEVSRVADLVSIKVES